MLVFIPTIKYDTFIFDPDLPKYHYIQIGFKDISIGKAPEKIVFCDDLNFICRHYALRRCVAGTIHCAMVDTYNCMEILVSNIENIYSLWDHGQLILILYRTRIMKNTIFVGPKNKTICRLKIPLTQKTQWCEYIEEVIHITNVKPDNNTEPLASLNKYRFPCQSNDISQD